MTSFIFNGVKKIFYNSVTYFSNESTLKHNFKNINFCGLILLRVFKFYTIDS